MKVSHSLIAIGGWGEGGKGGGAVGFRGPLYTVS